MAVRGLTLCKQFSMQTSAGLRRPFFQLPSTNNNRATAVAIANPENSVVITVVFVASLYCYPAETLTGEIMQKMARCSFP
jgi:hypothetical protein